MIRSPLRPIPATMPFDPARLPFFYGHAVLAFSIVGILMSLPGQTMGVSAFTDHLIEDLGIDRVRLTTAYLIGTLGSAFLLTPAGHLYDRLGARVMAAASALGLGAVLLSLSHAPALVGGVAALLPAPADAAAPLLVMSLGFFLLRFFGQGVLTMASRNMLMQWFERKRGLATGLSGVFVSLGFSLCPRILDGLIALHGWQGAWRLLALVIGILFVLFALVFFRDTPESCGLVPDGIPDAGTDERDGKTPRARHDFRLAEARRTYSFWVFIAAHWLLALYYTAFTFHVASLFEEVGRTRAEAFALFVPASLVSVGVRYAGGWAADRYELKYLLQIMMGATMLSALGILLLGTAAGPALLILGNGVAIGLFGLLTGVTWPTFFGRKHLGEVSGFNMAAMVLGSALGPWAFSLALSHTGSYAAGALACLALAALLAAGGLRADNPQNHNATTPTPGTP